MNPIKKKMVIGGGLICAVLAIALVSYMLINDGPHYTENDYFGKMGIESHASYEEFIARFGTPLSVDRDRDAITVRTNRGVTGYFQHGTSLSCVFITSPDYRFGKEKVGVGSTLHDVKVAYAEQQQITDNPSNEIGFIDGYRQGDFDHNYSIPWVTYAFDENEVITKVSITSAGM
ncbi:hypothetical protein [Paenibacillus sp. MMS18-CY102]|uniref:hypothetical protein n=1 Tax=Paenibacillus sp. MMS18-CY102 TaxID=2682849 RepID=UPI0013661550|nr:hypothetical protein [Paenibacillus sp. MMS18-CY102]MWC26668.1 hypothetical protein [Paenibacillus sp. MMS18-CY102]